MNSNKFISYHKYQESGYTCGTTCVQMIANYLDISYKDFNELIELCKTTSTLGTTDVGIKNALEQLNIKFEQNKLDEVKSIKLLNDIIDKGNLFLMRTLTKGIKHWIIVFGKKDNKYLISDPWLGLISYSIEDIIRIWKPRNFDGFKIFIK